MKIKCRTRFDITQTGVTGKFRAHLLPFKDRTGREIKNADNWHYSRNQQRNYETLIQLISLRTQPMDLEPPSMKNQCFEFNFSVETPDVFLDGVDDLALLNRDCEGVPMLVKLGEQGSLEPLIRTQGYEANTWFTKHAE